MADNFNIDEAASQMQQQVQNMAKKAINTVGKPIKNAAKKQARKLGKKVAKKIAQTVVKLTKAIIQAVLKLLAAIGPWGALIIVIILVISMTFDWAMDERGSSSHLSLDPSEENPTVMTDEGYVKASAMTEPQALIDAYYKYLSCDSFRKIYVDDSGTVHEYQFSNVNETADFAGLTDLYNRENYFFLSSYFLKMTDELFNNEEFYYPEQFVKPVFYDILPLENPEGEEVGKKYVTTLPLIDDGTDNAKILKSQLDPNETDLAGPYAIPTTTSPAPTGDANLPKREIPDDASLALLAQSKEYEMKEVTATDPTTGQSMTTTTLVDQGTNEVPGIWDYGFGSVLQYEPAVKDQSLSVSKISFTYHYHVTPWTSSTDDDGNTVTTENFDPATCCKVGTYEITLGSETGASIINNINTTISAFEEDNTTDGKSVTLVVCPTETQLNYMLANLSGVRGAISPEDEALAGVYFDDSTLQNAFGNASKVGDTYVRATSYPLKVPVITAAATFSGNIRYTHSSVETTNNFSDGTSSSSSVEGSWGSDCSEIEYATFTCGETVNTCSINRAGTITTIQPSSVSGEVTSPTGFGYIEDYGNHYKIFVPNKVRTDSDFKERVYNKQEGADLLTSAEKDSYDVDKDGEVTIMDFLIKLGLLTPYSGGTLGQAGEITQGDISAELQQQMEAMGCGMDEEGQIRLLAKVIGAEAGPNKLDQLLVGCVVINRVYSSEFSYADTIMEVITAPGQYASWSNGSIQSMEPTEEMLSSARQVMTGEFATPSNIVFQAAFTQGSTTWLTNVNGPGYYTHYYCCNGTPETTDIFGRTALTEAQAREQAEALHQQDIANGITSSGGGSSNSGISTGLPGDPNIKDGVYRGEKLYAAQGFSLQKAIASMRQISDRDKLGFLGTIYAIGSSAISNILEQIQKFGSIMHSLFGTDKDMVGLFSADIALYDIRNTVIQAVTFSNQDTYSNIADEFDPDVLQFLFVGEGGWAGSAQGTTGFGGGMLVPGTGSVFTGFGSPTSTHYGASTPWTSTSGSATLAIPEGTPVLAVGDTSVTEVEENDGKYKVTMVGTADGKSISITFDNLSSVNVSVGDSLSKGDTVGVAGAGGVVITLSVDGTNVDPMAYFYQPTFGAGASFYDVLDANGYIDETKKNELSALLNSANVRTSGPYDKWHDPSGINTRSVGQCTWWAWGRGYQFCEENNSMPSGAFGSGGGNGYGNGGDYYSRAAEDFEVGKAAAPNSWISWAWTYPDSNGNWYGHVAFVEAVGADGTILISECGTGYWNNGPGINVRTVKNTGTATNPNYNIGSKYSFIGFVYLDHPK